MTKEKSPLYILLLIVLLLGGCKTYNSGTCLSDNEIDELAAKAEKGDLNAARLIESHYMYCVEDPKMARVWTEKLASLGDAEAWYHLYSDDRTSNDANTKKKAFAELVKSGEGGYGFAQMTIATKYFTGDEVNKDHAQGEVWLRRAAQASNSDAMRSMSILLLAKERTKNSIIEAYRLSRHAQRVVDEQSVAGRSAMRQAETIRLVARKSRIPEKALEAASANLPAQKEPKANASPERFTATSGSPRSNAELADRQYAAGTKEGVVAGEGLLKSAALACDTYAMSDFATVSLLSATTGKSLAEAQSWARLVILDAPDSYMATDARMNIEFISIAAKSLGIPQATISAEAEKLVAQSKCRKSK
jgi:TPR repeat protein